MDQVQKDADPIKQDQPIIGAIKGALRSSLTSMASKLLSSEHTKLEDLSLEEQNLWKSFDNSDIYKFITGEPDCLPEFQFDWIEPCQVAAHLPPGLTLIPAQQQPAPPAPTGPAKLPVQQPNQPAPLAPTGPAKPPIQQPNQPAPPPALPAQLPEQPAPPVQEK